MEANIPSSPKEVKLREVWLVVLFVDVLGLCLEFIQCDLEEIREAVRFITVTLWFWWAVNIGCKISGYVIFCTLRTSFMGRGLHLSH